MSHKRKYNPNDSKDAEELMRIFESLEEDDRLAQEIDKASELELVLHYPQDGNDSDKDDAASDEEEQMTVQFDNIGRGVLSEKMDVRIVRQNNFEKQRTELLIEEDEEDNSAKQTKTQENDQNIPNTSVHNKNKIKKETRTWSEKILNKGNAKSLFSASLEPEIIQQWKANEYKPIHIFKLFFDENFINHLCKETVRYASQKGVAFTLSSEEMYKYLGILLLSGYHPLPSRRMYWESRSDSHSHLVSNTMSRNKFEQIHRFLHFNDNSMLNKDDRIYKVRPIISHVNQCFQKYLQPLDGSFSVDEAMEPYYGRHSMKQFIRGKPIRYGYKFWCVATYKGYVAKFSPYTGSGDKSQGTSLGSSVTEKLCVGFLPAGSTIYIDNFFTSLPLLSRLKIENINCIGTIRRDRIEHAPLKDIKNRLEGLIMRCKIQKTN